MIKPSFPLQAAGPVHGLDLTDDGSLLAIASAPSEGSAAVIVVRTADASPVATFAIGERVTPRLSLSEPVTHAMGVAFAGGSLFFGIQSAWERQLWRADPTGEPVLVARYTTDEFTSLIRSPDGRLLGVLGSHLDIRDLAAGGETVRFIPNAGAPHEPFHASFAANGPAVWLYGRDPGRVVLHDLATGRDLHAFEAPTPFGRHIAVAPSGRWLLVAGGSGTLLYDVDAGVRQPTLGSYALDSAARSRGVFGGFTPDGSTLVAATATLYEISVEGPTVASSVRSPASGLPRAFAMANRANTFAWATGDDQVAWASVV